ncbi:hypothetical protein [Chelativorans salis]|uniref:Uncharacterized protein n=1 Tax=Chelativorans salis TaxID=2978478 RepID=A0ABT2LUU0_9HYPH|nr:hypothetical protein [Chelativorans sp. EGI FJ00035]MCT7378292.1 hypothetical protein [Chelativorans sp. EGI FJ00035]
MTKSPLMRLPNVMGSGMVTVTFCLTQARTSPLLNLRHEEKINASYISRILRLTMLTPDIVEAILDGRQPLGLTLPVLLRPFPVEWEAQRRAVCC